MKRSEECLWDVAEVRPFTKAFSMTPVASKRVIDTFTAVFSPLSRRASFFLSFPPSSLVHAASSSNFRGLKTSNYCTLSLNLALGGSSLLLLLVLWVFVLWLTGWVWTLDLDLFCGFGLRLSACAQVTYHAGCLLTLTVYSRTRTAGGLEVGSMDWYGVASDAERARFPVRFHYTRSRGMMGCPTLSCPSRERMFYCTYLALCMHRTVTVSVFTAIIK